MRKLLAITATCLSLTACNVQNIIPANTNSSSPATVDKTIVAKVPKITHRNKKSRIKTKNGITITINPVSYSATKYVRTTLKQQPTLFVVNGQYNYKKFETPFLSVDPNEMKFNVTISNKTNRVLRLSNAVVTFDIDGLSVSESEHNYKDMLKAMIVPGTTKEFTIVGADLDQLKEDSGLIRLGLYEIGSDGWYSNFEWYFDYSLETVKEVAQKTVSNVTLTRRVAREVNGSINKLN